MWYGKKTIKVYSYGVEAPDNHLKEIEVQFKCATRYYRSLVDIECVFRRGREQLLQGNTEYAANALEIKSLGSRLSAIREEINALKASARSDVETPELDKEATVLKAALKKLYDMKKKLFAVATKELSYKQGLGALTDVAKAANKAARADAVLSGLWWGTYLLVEDAANKSFQDTKPWRMPRYQDENWSTLGIHYQPKKEPVSKIVSKTDNKSGFLCIEAPDESVYTSGRKTRRSGQRCRAQFRIGSDGRKPRMLDLSIFMHRPLPADGQVSWVKLIRENLAGIPRWKLQITVQTEKIVVAPDPTAECVSFDLGWAHEDDSDTAMRAGWAAGTDGYSQVLKLDEGLVYALTKADSIQSIRDRKTGIMRPVMSEWFRNSQLPEKMVERTSHFANWRSKGKIYSLYVYWQGHRFTGDDDGFRVLSDWATQDRHLELWEVNQRDKSLRRRLELYRTFAARLANKYMTLKLEDFDLRKISRRAKPEENRRGSARDQKKIVAPSILRLCLQQAFLCRGRTVIEVPAAYTSRRCCDCHQLTKLVVGKREQTCDICGVVFDRDENGARNILASEPVAKVPAKTKLLGTRRNRKSKRIVDSSVVAEAVGARSEVPKTP